MSLKHRIREKITKYFNYYKILIEMETRAQRKEKEKQYNLIIKNNVRVTIRRLTEEEIQMYQNVSTTMDSLISYPY